MKYFNGTETDYSYDAQRRRLSNLSVNATTTGKRIMNNAYSYDAVDNVLSVKNTSPVPASGMGGQMSHTYGYDGLYRLVSATGTFAGVGQKTAGYTLEMAYDNLHNITGKKQHVQQNDIQFDGALKAGYELAYHYAGNPFQISTLGDENYRTEGGAADDPARKEHRYGYDANGNLVYVNTDREKTGGMQAENALERKLLWDEENRLEAIDDNGFVSNYWYDAAGERTVKTYGESEQIYVNSLFSGGNTGTANFTAYVNPYLVVSRGGQYTKHIYIGSQRIVSKLGDLESYGADPRRIEYAGTGVEGSDIDYGNKYLVSQQTIKERYAKFGVPYFGEDNNDYVGGGVFGDRAASALARAIAENDNPEIYQYYYHADHLGSSSLITNLDGETVQHIEYVPFGEVFIEERNDVWNTPYLFNAKELDEETGLYYYGARYYDPRVSMWLSTDPSQENYPNISTYAYVAQNPVKFVDPLGLDVWEINADGEVNRIKDETQDAIYKLDSEGNRMTGEGNSVVFAYETIEQYTKTVPIKNDEPKELIIFEVKGDENASKMYDVLINPDNNNIEWGHVKVGAVGSGRNLIGTGKDPSRSYMGDYALKTGYTIRQDNHNHPSHTIYPSESDINVAKKITDRFPQATFYIFTAPNKSYRYNSGDALIF